MNNLALFVLGSFRAILGDKTLPGFRTHKVEALLVYLAVEPGPQRRESLMDLLWPGLPERSARGNLRQIIYLLRKAVPEVALKDEHGRGSVPLLITNRQTLQLNPAAAITIDAVQFEQLLERVNNHEHLDLPNCPACRKELETAVLLYSGDFLADFYLDDSNEFEDWSQSRREYYRRKVLDALEILTTIYSAQKEYPLARSYVERQLEIDNLRESAFRQLMEIMALSGQRSEALTVYENCRRILAEELGMAPTKRTTQVYEQILAGDLAFGKPLTQGVRGYELKDEIGQGAYGAIHRAIQPSIGREVAIKVIRRKYANDPVFIRRFEAEAQIVAGLEHPYIVPLYDYWRDPEGAYLVMRYLRGGNLLSALSQGPWNLEQTVKMLDQIASALSAAHCQGVVHRDIKPANILLDTAGNAYLSDFGVAKSLDGEWGLTAEGAIIGTFDYISPEQILNEQVGPQSDIYSLGAVLYETLTGERPFPDVSMASILYKHLNEAVPLVSSSRPDLPPQIDTVIQRATSKRPTNRYADALEMARAFRAAVQESDEASAMTLPQLPPVLEVYNPYKGLRAFQEADADDFFGREALVEQLITRMDPTHAGRADGSRWADTRFLAVVGPSGSGKSSTVKAGLIPALREGAIPAGRHTAASDKWFVAEMVPGNHPLEELELALWPIAVDPPPSLVEPMQKDTRGLLRTIRRILPDEEEAQLLLVIDQFEELFTLVEDEERRTFFIDSLITALRAPRTPLRVVVTLRADFYDRPLQYESLGRLLKENTEIVLPLIPEELTWAIQEPARRVGVALERGLAPAIIADLTDQPGALPLLQYALTELFERRSHELMTREAYEAIGGVLGALGRRAEEIYADLDEAWQTLTRQLFLRLVTLGEGVEDTRRRVLRSELEALDRDSNKVISAVLDDFGRARLLIFDRDPTNREATVEVAHEALLREWRRLRRWLDESRGDVRMQRLLAAATTEWQANDQEPGFLLRAARLDQFAGWAEANTVALTPDEKNFLAASVFARRERQEEEQQRRFRELRSAQALAESESQRAEIERKRAEEQARSTRKIRRTARLLAGLAVVAVLLAVGAFQLFRQAQQNEKLAASRELAAAALNNLEIDPGLSVLLALEAVDVADTREAQNALHQAVPAMHLLHTFVGHENFLQVMALSQDGRLLATGGPEQIKLWDVDSGEELLTLDTPSQAAKALAFSPDGHYLATGGYWLPDNIWKLEVEPTGTKLNAGKVLTLTGHSDAGMVADFSPDGRLLATGNNDATVRLWDAANGEEVAVLAGHEQKPAVLTTGLMGITDLEFSPDGLSLATAGTDGTVRLWEIPSAKELHVIPGSGRAFTKVDFSPDGDRLAATSEDGTIRVWDLATDPGMALPTMAITEDGIEAVQFSPDGQALAAGSRDGTVILRDASSGREMLALHGHTGSVRDLLFTPDGKRLLTIAEDKTARLWDISPDREIQTLSPGGWPAYSPDGAHLAIRGLDGRILIYDTNSGQVSLTISDQPVRGVIVYSLDGSLLATGRWDGTAKIWDSATGKELLAMEGHLDRVHALAFSPDGNYLATGDGLAGAGQASVRIWDTHLGQELLNLPATDWLVSAVEFSPDGEQVAAATWGIGGNHAIKVWDAHSGQLLHSQPVDLPYDLAYSPDGNMVAVALEQGNSILWDITGESWTEALVLTGHASSVGRVNFNHTGDQLVTASFDGTARVWDTTTGEELTNLAGHGDQVVMADFSPHGKRIVTLAVPDITRIFTLDLDELVDLARERVTRPLSLAECRRYLHRENCPE